MKELVVISGKGGTGKTSLVASFAALSENAVLADCDVDAADLYLILKPVLRYKEAFSGGKRACIEAEKCTGCGKCMEVCRFDAVSVDKSADLQGRKVYRIDPIACEGCGVCAWFCPEKAIDFSEAINGEWFVSDTRHGPMLHAALGIAEGNSGKLVSKLREEAQKIAHESQRGLLLIDGSPGIGCPVIASIVGSDLILIVTEPTLSGRHDLERVADLAKHFGIPGLVCINKWDLNPEMADAIEAEATKRGLKIAGRVRYDNGVTKAQIQGKSIVEHQKNGGAKDIGEVWRTVLSELERESITEQASGRERYSKK